MNALVSFDRVFEVLDLTPMIADAPGARPVPEAASVEFQHVGFRYPGAARRSTSASPSAPRRSATCRAGSG